MDTQTILYILVAIISFNFIISQVLDYLNMRNWSPELPDELRSYYDKEKYKKAQQYHREKNRVSTFAEILNFVILLVFLLAGGFGWMSNLLQQYIEHDILLALAYFGVLGLLGSIINLPFSLYNIFVIEEKYGFNKTTVKTYVLDRIKGTLLAVIIGGGLGYLILWMVMELGGNFWIYAWIVIGVFVLFLNVFYTSLIVPLFNKLKPLSPGLLREQIEGYAARVDFPLTNIMEIDGSKRSTKANAFFSGLGKSKKIVLYDTLIEKHTTDELVAVLAHEVGHYKKKHIQRGMILSVLTTGFMLWLLSKFIFNEDLSLALGENEMAIHVNLIAFSILYEPISEILGLLMNMLSRRHEYQADAFAAATADKQAFKEALIKLSTDNLSNLNPHPAYVFVHYSHPPLLSRIKALG